MLELVLGMTFVYLILALMCTSINEWIAQVLRSRAYILRVGIERLLGDPKLADKLYAHPLIQTMAFSDVQPVWFKRSTRVLNLFLHPLPADHHPAYIPPRRSSWPWPIFCAGTEKRRSKN